MSYYRPRGHAAPARLGLFWLAVAVLAMPAAARLGR